MNTGTLTLAATLAISITGNIIQALNSWRENERYKQEMRDKLSVIMRSIKDIIYDQDFKFRSFLDKEVVLSDKELKQLVDETIKSIIELQASVNAVLGATAYDAKISELRIMWGRIIKIEAETRDINHLSTLIERRIDEE